MFLGGVGRQTMMMAMATMTAADDEGRGQCRHARLGGGLQGGRRRVGGEQQRH
jgi:hypothetical protein